MSLQQGPIDLLISSVAHGSQMLLAVKKICLEKEQYHKAVISDFLTSSKLEDIRQIPQKYPDQQLNPMVELANLYYLTTSSSLTIIAYGLDALLEHFSNSSQALLVNKLLTPSHRPLYLLAKTKLNVEQHLTDYLREHKGLEKSSPEEHVKIKLEQTVNALDTDIKTLSETERLIIEYYETVLKAEIVIKELAEFEKSLLSLKVQLSTLTPVEIVAPPSNWETSFGNPEVFTSDNLAELLSNRLSLRTPDPADWDNLSLPGSKRSSLLQPIELSVMNTALLTQFHQKMGPQASSSDTEDEEIFSREKEKASQLKDTLLPGL